MARLDEGLRRGRSLTLVSAPAGFGKTSIVGEWASGCGRAVAWLSLDEADGELPRFLLYLAAALGSVEKGFCADAMAALQLSLNPPAELILGGIINEIDGLSRDIILVLDDYHAVDSARVDEAVAFLLDHPSPRLHLAIATREDPALPLARLRARDHLTELRAADLRFTYEEARDFLGNAMGLDLSDDLVQAIEGRTEGWVAGLQLAALSLADQGDAANFVEAFSGSHRFALDYLAEEVFRRQGGGVQAFLLRTSILDRLCGPLCDFLMGDGAELGPGLAASGQETLEALVRANLFITSVDSEARWYRYHGLFAEVLRQRLGREEAARLHVRVSQWFEAEGLYLDAFRHAAAGGDIDRAAGLAGSREMPIHFPGTVPAILDWLVSLPPTVLEGRPGLRVLFATLSLAAGRASGVEEALDAAEESLRALVGEARPRALVGRIAAARATLALSRYQAEAIVAQARKALDYLPGDDLAFRFTALWTMAFGQMLRGERAAAGDGFAKALALSKRSGDPFASQLALCSMGEVAEADNRLHEAAATYRRAIAVFGDHPLPNASEAHLGLARVSYEWNDLDGAEAEGEQSLLLSRQYDQALDRFVPCELFLARVKLARGLVGVAASRLDGLAATARARGFLHRLPELAALRVEVHLRLGETEAATRLAGSYDLPLSQARVLLARGEASRARTLLDAQRAQMEGWGWRKEALEATTLLALALSEDGQKDAALGVLDEALAPAEAGGCIRLFLDEGRPMAELLSAAARQGKKADYAGHLLGAFAAEASPSPPSMTLMDPLSRRELEVLGLIAQGLSNQEIGERLFLALDTVKGHNRRIFEKLEVKRRTEAIARSRELGLL